MRKILLGLCFGFTLTISSCTKDWNCECSYTDGNTNWTVNSTVEDATKNEAESECNDSGTFGSASYNCEIQ